MIVTEMEIRLDHDGTNRPLRPSLIQDIRGSIDSEVFIRICRREVDVASIGLQTRIGLSVFRLSVNTSILPEAQPGGSST